MPTANESKAIEFLQRTATDNARIVSSNDLTYFQIAEARASKRFFVDEETGFGWALLPWDLTTDKDRQREGHKASTQYLQPSEPQAAPVESVPSVDLRAYELEQLRRANAELLEQNARLEQQISDAAEVISCRGEKLISIYDALGVCSIKEALPKAISIHALTAERDKLKSELASEKAESQLLRNSLSDALEKQPPYDEQVIELTKQLASAKEQLAKVVQPEVQYAWRDARPEDAGKGYKLQVRDFDNLEWNRVDGQIIAYNTDAPLGMCWQLNPTRWRFCQVYAPVEAPPAESEWRELTKWDQYSGPGQVRDSDELDWCDAHIIYIDADSGMMPFIAKEPGDEATFFAFARVRRKVGAE